MDFFFVLFVARICNFATMNINEFGGFSKKYYTENIRNSLCYLPHIYSGKRNHFSKIDKGRNHHHHTASSFFIRRENKLLEFISFKKKV